MKKNYLDTLIQISKAEAIIFSFTTEKNVIDFGMHRFDVIFKEKCKY